MLIGRKRPLQPTYRSKIVDVSSETREKKARQIMPIFMDQTILEPTKDALPTVKFRPDADIGAYYTPDTTSTDTDLIWSLASILFKPDIALVGRWLRDLIKPGLESQLERTSKIYPDDPFVRTFVYLSFGQRDLAAESAQENNDYSLGMYIVHSELKDLMTVVREQIASFKLKGEWKTMSVFHKKCWYTIAGDVGFMIEDDFVVTEGVYWQSTLGMYVWYVNRQGTLSLVQYNKALDKSIADIHHLRTVQHTALPDTSCLWYQLLQFFKGDKKVAHLEEWPLDLVFLLSLYHPESGMDESFVKKWIDQLERMDMAEWAIYASFFLKNPQQHVSYLLRQCEWQDESRLLNEYHIPKKQIQIAKALNAHDAWDYEAEYKHLVEGGLFDQAKLALLHFLLPKLFQSNHHYVLYAIHDSFFVRY
ncbi:hypothetical protein EDC96DRAFT_500049 [Choanephora cucurbitarum]|nr:hypothetical protein EDC96DRAFT_500049 [Choanephora cucurbitarum]